jgi:aryl-alcohol dehydrogenase-like predicted oxidoreductase
MKLRRLGNTGIHVSELCLGAMNFGQPDWGVDEKTSVDVIRVFLEAGGNFIDTADVYTGGISEEICGRALKPVRDQVIIATKGHFPVTMRFGEPPAHANALGSSRRYLTLALEASLRRLQTDYIDLYQVHCWDAVTPIEETLSTLDAFIKSGKVRYIGLSNFDAWQIAEARQFCIRFNWEPFVSAQMQYSLACRDIERAVVPVCERYDIGILPWSPLGGGVLTGKYRRDLTGPSGTRFGATPDDANVWRRQFVNNRNLDIADAVAAIARQCESTPTTVAIAWLLGRPAVSSVIVGPKTVAQLQENTAACALRLNPEHWTRLNEVSAPFATYPEQFIAKNKRNMPAEAS